MSKSRKAQIRRGRVRRVRPHTRRDAMLQRPLSPSRPRRMWDTGEMGEQRVGTVSVLRYASSCSTCTERGNVPARETLADGTADGSFELCCCWASGHVHESSALSRLPRAPVQSRFARVRCISANDMRILEQYIRSHLHHPLFLFPSSSSISPSSTCISPSPLFPLCNHLPSQAGAPTASVLSLKHLGTRVTRAACASSHLHNQPIRSRDTPLLQPAPSPSSALRAPFKHSFNTLSTTSRVSRVPFLDASPLKNAS